MCVMTTKLKRVTTRERVAWKCIHENSNKDTWLPLCKPGEFLRGAWAAAQNEVGFNCYLSYRDARNSGWSTSAHPVKVRIRKVEGYGDFGGLRVVFAKEIFVPRKRKGGL